MPLYYFVNLIPGIMCTSFWLPRFHLLAEFDDGKRSCRKRLAGHNERRRKPQVGIQSGRTGKLLQSYNGITSILFNF